MYQEIVKRKQSVVDQMAWPFVKIVLMYHQRVKNENSLNWINDRTSCGNCIAVYENC